MDSWMIVACLACIWIGLNCEEEPECGSSGVPTWDESMFNDSRIVGGRAAKYGEFPFLVSIRLGGKMFGQHHCGGAILKRKWILTAAHCLVGYSPKQFFVRVGEYNLTHEDHDEADYKVEKIVLHPQLYEPKRYNNDIALMKLFNPIEYTDYVKPTCLPKGRHDEITGMGLKAIIMGWGFTEEHKKVRSPILQKVAVQVHSRETCQKLFNEAGKKVTFHAGQFCAGYKEGGKDSCQGDSGGPLTTKEEPYTNKKYTVIGVVSAGIGCGRPNLPGVYTGVADKMDWIQETIAS